MDDNQKLGKVPTHQETQARIKKLAIVGTAINNTYSETNQDYLTEFRMAKASLHDFLQDIEDMDLPEESKQGMRDLVAYLEDKIDKRIANTSLPEDKKIP